MKPLRAKIQTIKGSGSRNIASDAPGIANDGMTSKKAGSVLVAIPGLSLGIFKKAAKTEEFAVFQGNLRVRTFK
jgi:hypothetical protein